MQQHQTVGSSNSVSNFPPAEKNGARTLMASKMVSVNIRLNPAGLVILLVSLAFFFLYMFGGLLVKSRKSAELDGPRGLQTDISLKELLAVCIEVAQEGGVKVKQVRGQSDLGQLSKGKTLEGVDDPLTLADQMSHKIMYHGIKKAFPDLKVISEEHDVGKVDVSDVRTPRKFLEELDNVLRTDRRVAIGDVTVWVDPLDATKEYTENKIEYVTTMACVAVKGEPIIGVIHKPFEKYTAWAWQDHGHSTNLEFARNSARSSRGGPKTRVIISMSHTGTAGELGRAAFGAERTTVIPAAGAGYKTLEVIQGHADAYVHITAIKKWDICAGNAILRALGGHMTDLDGSLFDYSATSDPLNKRGLLATFQEDHEEMLGKLQVARLNTDQNGKL